MEQTDPKNFFTGIWKAFGFQRKSDQEWVPDPAYARHRLIWMFAEPRKIQCPWGETIFKGKIAEYRDNLIAQEVDYVYFSGKQTFSIDRSTYESSGMLLAALEERYHIEVVDDKTLCLYNICHTISRPQDSNFRIFIKRMS